MMHDHVEDDHEILTSRSESHWLPTSQRAHTRSRRNCFKNDFNIFQHISTYFSYSKAFKHHQDWESQRADALRGRLLLRRSWRALGRWRQAAPRLRAQVEPWMTAQKSADFGCFVCFCHLFSAHVLFAIRWKHDSCRTDGHPFGSRISHLSV